MRRAGLIFLFISIVMLPVITVTAQQVLPSLHILNVLYPSDSQFTYTYVEFEAMCEMTYGGMGLSFYIDTPGPITVNFYPHSAGGCTGPAVRTFTIQYTPGEFYTILLYPDTSSNPAYALFNHDVSPAPPGKARLYVINGYSAPTVDFIFQRQGHGPETTLTLANGQQQSFDIAAGKWDITLNGVSLPVQFFTWDEPYRPGDYWLVMTAGPVNEGVIGIWDFRFGG